MSGAQAGGLLLREVPAWRVTFTAVASLVAVLCGAYALSPLGGESFHWFLMMPIMGLVLAGLASPFAALEAQLFARAVEWSNLGLGVVLTLLGSSRERERGVLLALSCGVTLLALGRAGLVESERRAKFVPAAFRSSLLLLMVLALADAQSFGLFGAAILREAPGSGALLLAAAAALTVGFLLLMRLSLVGLFVNVAACLGVLVLTLVATLDKLSPVLFTLAAVHLLVAAPTLALATRRRPVGVTLSPRARAIGATGAIVALMLLSIASWLVRS